MSKFCSWLGNYRWCREGFVARIMQNLRTKSLLRPYFCAVWGEIGCGLISLKIPRLYLLDIFLDTGLFHVWGTDFDVDQFEVIRSMLGKSLVISCNLINMIRGWTTTQLYGDYCVSEKKRIPESTAAKPDQSSLERVLSVLIAFWQASLDSDDGSKDQRDCGWGYRTGQHSWLQRCHAPAQARPGEWRASTYRDRWERLRILCQASISKRLKWLMEKHQSC